MNIDIGKIQIKTDNKSAICKIADRIASIKWWYSNSWYTNIAYEVGITFTPVRLIEVEERVMLFDFKVNGGSTGYMIDPFAREVYNYGEHKVIYQQCYPPNPIGCLYVNVVWMGDIN